jgi:hypothetical protein
VFDFALSVYNLFVCLFVFSFVRLFVCVCIMQTACLSVQFVLLGHTFTESNCTKILVPADLEMK